MRPWARYLISRLLFTVINIFLGVSIIFVLLRLLPATAVELRLRHAYSLGMLRYPEEAERLREAWSRFYGIETDPVMQYFELWRRLLTLDFGPSLISFPTPVRTLLMNSLPWTIMLLTVSIVVSWSLGTALGIISGSAPNSRVSKLLVGLSSALYPIPYYILGLVLIFTFAYLIPLFPLGGGISVVPPHLTGNPAHDLALILNIIHHAALPSFSLILPMGLGWFFLSAYSSTISGNLEEHIRFARMLGLREGTIRWRHLWGEIRLAQTTLLTLQMSQILGGAVLTEIIFAYPGLGYLVFRAIGVFDYNLLAAVALVSCLVVSLSVLVIDLLTPLLDPRARAD